MGLPEKKVMVTSGDETGGHRRKPPDPQRPAEHRDVVICLNNGITV